MKSINMFENDFKLQNWFGIIATGAEIYSCITRCQCPRIGTKLTGNAKIHVQQSDF